MHRPLRKTRHRVGAPLDGFAIVHSYKSNEDRVGVHGFGTRLYITKSATLEVSLSNMHGDCFRKGLLGCLNRNRHRL